ncbi:MAG: PEGA domain-containing protein [Holophagales bacterium]|nr:PEGA domain-containing protein [Holophagales bacterium]
MRGGQGGPPPGGGSGGGNHGGAYPGGHPGGGHSGGGHYGGGYYGGHRGWYCPPTYYAGSSWLWGGPWDWWWGWGAGWGWGGGWGPYGGGVYVISDVAGVPAGNQYARVDTDVSPEAAEVYLDATLIGQADDFDGYPDYLYLAAGKYRLEFRHPSYETVVKEIDVQPGQAIAINDEMKLLAGLKKLQVVDPERHGTPLGRVFGKPEAARSAGVTGRTGRFEVTGEPDSLRLDEAGEIEEIDEDVLPPKRPAPPAAPEAWRAPDAMPGDVAPASQGRLRFDVEPDDAAVYVDDRYVGTAEELGGLRRGLRVKPGKHTVTVVRPGYASKTVDVESKPGAAVDVVIELEK